MDALKNDYDCIAVDLYGFGFSDKNDSADYIIEAQARRVMAMMDALGVETFDLMGHSMGGAIALLLTAEHPERVRKVIEVDGVVTGQLTPYIRRVIVPPLRIGYYIPQLWDISRIGFRRWPWYKHIYADNALTYERDIIALGSEDLLMSVIPGGEAATYHALNAINQINLTAALREIRVPTLIIFGEADNTVPLSEGHYAKTHIPNSRLLVYERCGHNPMLEMPERFAADVKAFLQG